jgi:cytochrome c5
MRFLLFAATLPISAALALADSGKPTRAGGEVVRRQCALCHGPGIGGAPRIGDRSAWAPRAKGGLDALVRSAAMGRGGMPPRGGMSDLSEGELRAAVLYMLELSDADAP